MNQRSRKRVILLKWMAHDAINVNKHELKSIDQSATAVMPDSADKPHCLHWWIEICSCFIILELICCISIIRRTERSGKFKVVLCTQATFLSWEWKVSVDFG